MIVALLIVLLVITAVMGVYAVDEWRQQKWNDLPVYRASQEWLPIDDGLPLWLRRPEPMRPRPYDWQDEQESADA